MLRNRVCLAHAMLKRPAFEFYPDPPLLAHKQALLCIFFLRVSDKRDHPRHTRPPER